MLRERAGIIRKCRKTGSSEVASDGETILEKKLQVAGEVEDKAVTSGDTKDLNINIKGRGGR